MAAGKTQVATVTVLTFATPEAAAQTLTILCHRHAEHLITLHDAVVVSWKYGSAGPERASADLRDVGLLGGMCCGILVGSMMQVPLFGLIIGAALGTLGGWMRACGIGDELVTGVCRYIGEGSSALLLMTTDSTLDRVPVALKMVQVEMPWQHACGCAPAWRRVLSSLQPS